jgi:hypothetical protein
MTPFHSHSATLADLEDCFGQIGPCACQIKRGFGFVVSVTSDWSTSRKAAFLNQTFHSCRSMKILRMLPRLSPSTTKGTSLARRSRSNSPSPERTSRKRVRLPMCCFEHVQTLTFPSDFLPRRLAAAEGCARGPPRSQRLRCWRVRLSRLHSNISNAQLTCPRPDRPRGGRGGRAGAGPDRYGGAPPPSYAPPYGGGRYDDRPPPIERGYGPPPRDERYGAPPRVDYRSAPPPPAPYGAPIDRPPYDPYYAPYPAAAVPGYPPPPAAPYDRPPYAPPMPVAAPAGVRDPYGSERYPPAPGAARSPVMAAPYDAARGGMPPPLPGAGYGAVDPYGRPAPLDPMSAPYDPRDERGAGARYQPYPSRDERYGGRSPGRCVAAVPILSRLLLPLQRHFARNLTPDPTSLLCSGPPGLERRRSMSPRRNGAPDPYARDPYGSNGYPAPYDSRGPPPPSAYGAGGYGGRSPPRYPPIDEYVPRR